LLITERDLKLVRHFEEYKFATINQIEKMFFRNQTYSYNIARRRLLELKKFGYIKVSRDSLTTTFARSGTR